MRELGGYRPGLRPSPETRCTAENTNGGAAQAAEFGVKALEAKQPRNLERVR